MSSHRKRSSSPSPNPNPNPKRRHGPSFPSYLDVPDLPPKIRHLCHLLHTTPPHYLESVLSASSIAITSSDVESVLKLSYSLPSPAVKFFRWAGTRLHHSLSPYSWNLAVDLLGRNRLFDAMWDCVRSMRSQSLLSLATFASVFSSLSAADRFDDVLKAFDEMPSLYGVPADTPALNSLLSALCRESRLPLALHVLDTRARSVPPDPDTFAILLEAFDADPRPDPRSARRVFDDMTRRIGWDPANVPAYTAFLNILLNAKEFVDVIRYVKILKENRCYPGITFFKNSVAAFTKRKDAKNASAVWDAIVGRNGCVPDTRLYNSMIALQCEGGQLEAARRYLDEMVTFGVFPDAETYDMLLDFLLMGRKLRDAEEVFKEMVRNEFVPSARNCESALRFFPDSEEWAMGMKVWRCMVENGYQLEESSNTLIGKMIRFDMLPEACRLAEDMIDHGIKLTSASLSRLRVSLLKAGQVNLYEHIFKKWKLH